VYKSCEPQKVRQFKRKEKGAESDPMIVDVPSDAQAGDALVPDVANVKETTSKPPNPYKRNLIFGINSCTALLSKQLFALKAHHTIPETSAIKDKPAEVTSVPKDELALFLCTEDVKPMQILDHLPSLATMCGVPFVHLPATSQEALVRKLNIPRVNCFILVMVGILRVLCSSMRTSNCFRTSHFHRMHSYHK
jgi:ribosomal protein L7Ae-like RNA K-turn-binding protein